MKTIHNILTKIFLILALGAGWGSSAAWAQTSAFSFTSWDHGSFSALTEYNTPIYVSSSLTTTQEGDLNVNIAYWNGSWSFVAFGVDLVDASGRVVKSNYESQKLGTAKNYTYTLTSVPVGTYTVRYWTSTKGTDGSAFNGNAGQANVTYPNSTVGATPARTTITRNDIKEACITPNGVPAELWSKVQTYTAQGAGLLYKDDACTLNAGHYTMTFTYSGGDSSGHNDRLNLRGVELRDGSGNVVSSDCHVGYTGSAQSNTTYSFDVPTAGSYTVRTIVLPEDGTSTCPRSKGNIAYTFEAAAVAVDVDCTFDPAAGTVSDLSTVTVSPSDGDTYLTAPADYNEYYPENPLPIVLPRLTKAGDEDVVAESIVPSGAYNSYTIRFTSAIPDGDYTLVLPQGTFYTLDAEFNVVPVSEMTANYTLSTAYPLTPSTEYTLSYESGTAFQEAFSGVTITITPTGGKTVKSVTENGGSYNADNTPYLIPASASSNQRGLHKAPAGAKLASAVTKTSDGVYDITFDPAVTEAGNYDLVIPQGAFYVTDGEETLPVAKLTAAYTVGDPHEWVTIKNHNRSDGYFSLSASGLEANEQLKWGVNSPSGAGEYWAFVGDDTNGYKIINKAYGPDYVFGLEGTNTNDRARMYHVSEANPVNTLFDKVPSNTTGEFCIVLHSNQSVGLNNNGSNLKVWNTGNLGVNKHKGDGGSTFAIADVEAATIAACPSYNIYKVNIMGGSNTDTARYTGDSSNLLGLTTVQNNRYMALKESSGVPTISNFELTKATPFTSPELVVGPADFTGVDCLNFFEPVETVEWTVQITGLDNDYSVINKNYPSSAKSGGKVRIAADGGNPATDLFVNCADKFIWGPVIDATNRIATFTVKEPVTDVANLTDGFYQLQLVATKDNSGNVVDFQARLGSILNTSTVNVKSYYYYVMPWFSHNSYNAGSQSYKYSGVYASGNAPASFVRITRDASGNIQFQSIRGHYCERPDVASRDALNIATSDYKIEDGMFSIKGWTKEGYWSGTGASGDEGPHEAYGGGFQEFYYAAKADLSSCKVYKVDFENWVQGSSVKADPTATYRGTTATNYGLPTVYRNGYFFFPEDYTPVASDFTVNGVVYANMGVEVSAEADANGIYTLTFKEEATTWTVKINDGYKVSYKGGELKGNDETIAAADDVAAIDLTVNCTDKFVWGPVIDSENKIITYDIRDLATSLTAGRWYQIQILDRRGKYNGNNWSDSFYNTLNAQTTITKKSNTLYVMNYPSMDMNTYPTEVSGVPIPERDTYWSYVYIADVDASNNIAWQRPNGDYIKNTGQDNGTTLARNWALTYNGADKSFAWNGGIIPWNDLGDNGYKHLALGYTGYGTLTGTFQSFIHPVKSGEDYDIYKVVLDDDDVATYGGSASGAFIANGGKLEFTEKTINNGNYIFLPKGTTPQLSDFSFTDPKTHECFIDKSEDIWTLSLVSKYIFDPATEYTLDPASGTKNMEEISTITLHFSLAAGKSVKCVTEDGALTDEYCPYLTSVSSPSTPIKATELRKTDDGEYVITFDAVTDVDNYVLTIPEGAFVVTDDGTDLPAAAITAHYTVGDPREWVIIKNARNAKGCISLSNDGLNTLDQLKWGVSSATGAGEYWYLKEDGDEGYQLINKAYGDDFVLGIESLNDGAMIRMYHISEADPVRTHFDKMESTNNDARGAYVLLLHSNHSIAISDFGSSTFKVWKASGESNHLGDRGSAFFITTVTKTALDACPNYNVYKVEGYEPVTYTGTRAFDKRSTATDSFPYIILEAPTGDEPEVTKEQLSIPAGREIESVEVLPASANPNSSYIKILRINLTKYFLSEPGWYQMTISSAGGTNAYAVYNTEREGAVEGNAYPLAISASAASQAEYNVEKYRFDARQWVYINCNPTSGKWTMQALDGHYLNAEMQATTAAETFDYVFLVSADADREHHYTGPSQTLTSATVAGSVPFLVAGATNRQVKFHPVVHTPVQHGASKAIFTDPAPSPSAHRIAPESTTEYDIWKVVTINGGWTVSGDVSADTRVSCLNSANIGIANVYKNGYFVFPAGTTVNASDFTVGGYHNRTSVPDGVYAALSDVTVNNATGNDATYTRTTDGVTVRTQLDAAAKTITITITTDMTKRPLMPRTSFYVDKATSEYAHLVGPNDGWTEINGHKVQNTNHFYNVQYIKPGATRRVMLPQIGSGSTDWTSDNRINQYQHWYNLDGGGAIPSGLTNIRAANSASGSLLGNSLGLSNSVDKNFNFSMPTSGTTDYTIVQEASRWHDGQSTFIAGESYNGIQRSDPNGEVADGALCFLEPTLSQRQFYEFHSAHEIATKLLQYKKDGSRKYTIVDGKKIVDGQPVEDTELKLDWLEGCVEIVMPTKSSKITGEVLPLDMQVFNYWCYDGAGKGDANLVNADRAPLSGDLGGKAKIVVKFTDKDGTPHQSEPSDGIITDTRTGITFGHTSSIHPRLTAGQRSIGLFYDLSQSNTEICSQTGRPRYIEFEYPGSDRIVTSDDKDTYISVYLQPDDDTESLYQIKQFHLIFQDGTELIRKSQVDALPATNNRSPEFKKTLVKASELSFPYYNGPYIDAYGDSQGSSSSQYPIKYEEMSYAYYHNSNDQVANKNCTYGSLAWGEYGLFNYLKLGGTDYYTVNDQGTGYFIYADASELPGSLATIKMDGQMCANNVLYCSMYITNAFGTYGDYNGTWSNSGNCKGETPASILIRIYGVDNHGNRTNIYNFCPGVVGSGEWAQMAFNFAPYSLVLPDGSSAAEHPFDTFEFEIVSNCRSSWGGDYAIDNLQIFVGKPSVEPERIAPLCGHELDVVLIRTNFDDLLKAANLVSDEVGCTTDEMLADAATNNGAKAFGVYCFVDSEKYWEALENYTGDKSNVAALVNHAFSQALVGERVDGSAAPAYHIIRFSTCYSDHEKYNYGLLANPETNPVVQALREYIPATANSPQVRDLVFNAKIRDDGDAAGNELQAGREYFLVFHPIEGSAIDHLGTDPTNDSVLQYANTNLNGYSFGLDYATPEAMELGCPVLKRFKIQPAYRLTVDAEEQNSITEMPFCQGSAPTVDVTNTIYTAGGEVQDNNEVLYYDWYSGSLENYYHQVPNTSVATEIGLDGGADPKNTKFKLSPTDPADRQFCLDEVLLVFRSHFPDAIDLEGNKPDGTTYDGLPLTEDAQKRHDDNMEDYTLAMQKFLQKYVEYPGGDISKTPRLRLHRKQVQLDLGEVQNNEVAALVAVPTARREGFRRFDTHDFSLSCYDPQEVSFMPKHTAPTSVIGHGELDSHYAGLLNSIPIRMTQSQAEAISNGHKLQIPLRQLNTSGFYDGVEYFDDASAAPSQQRSGQHRLPKSKNNQLQKLLDNLLSKLSKDKNNKDKNFVVVENPVKFEVNATKSDLFISETNDPQWQMNVVNEVGDTFLPCVGSLVEISAATAEGRDEKDNYVVVRFNRLNDGMLNGATVPDAEGTAYTFKTDANGRYCYPDKGLTVVGTGDEAKNVEHKAYREFVPREGYYYILKGYFHESLDESAAGDVGERANDVSCDGTIIIPIKVVPEYMKWTGAVNSDWNNDRNWARADRTDLVTVADVDASSEGTDVQNPTEAYRNYIYNEYDHRGRHEELDYVHTEHNGVATATNDDGLPYVAYAHTSQYTYTRTGDAPDYTYTRTLEEKCFAGTDDSSQAFYDSSQEYCCLYNNQTQQREYYPIANVTVADKVVTAINGEAVADPTLYTVRLPFTAVYDYKGVDVSEMTWTDNTASSDREVVEYIPREGKSIYLPTDYVSSVAYGTTTYAPMKTTRIIIPANTPHAPMLSKAGVRGLAHADGKDILDLSSTTTPYIEYDMPVLTPDNPNDPEAVYTVEPYYENKVKEIHFEPGAVMYNAQYLDYDRAWVDYELQQGKWYTVSSPLQETYAGDWYSPTDEGANRGKQLTPLFTPITYDFTLNNRFDPAYYQRSWDQGKATMYRMPGDGMVQTDADGNPIDFKYWGQSGYGVNKVNVAQRLNWSHVYNDVTIDYSTAGGFSVRPVVPNADADATVIMRLPKADTQYLYYAENDGLQDNLNPADYGDHYVGDLTAMPRGAGQYRLMSDKLNGADGLTVKVKSQNEYYLVSNPFMAPLDMTAFFDANDGFDKKYWLIDAGHQKVGVRTAGSWVTTDSIPTVAPLQGFFVKRTSGSGEVTVIYNAAMQAGPSNPAPDPDPAPSQRRGKAKAAATTTDAPVLRIEAANGKAQSTALCYFSAAADNAVKAGEDAETLLDSNLADNVSTVFTLAPSDKGEAQALQFNALSTEVQYIPLGVIAPTDSTETTVRLTGTDALAAAMTGTPHLYDALDDTFVTIAEGMTFTVTGTTSERYFIVSGLTKPELDDEAASEVDGRLYDLRGIRVASPQHGTVTISRSRKEYNK